MLRKTLTKTFLTLNPVLRRRDDPCSPPSYNTWLTNNEVSAIISRNGW